MKIYIILFSVLLFTCTVKEVYSQNPCNHLTIVAFNDSSSVLPEDQQQYLIDYVNTIDTSDLIHFNVEFDIRNESPDALNDTRSLLVQKIINEQLSPYKVKYKFIPAEGPGYFKVSRAGNDQVGPSHSIHNSIVIYADCNSLYPEIMELRQSYIDSMHTQTREHIIIDTLSNYYSKRWYLKLSQPQRDLVFIRNFSNKLYQYDFIDLMVNHSELILVEAYEVFKRIDCQTTLDKIEEFRRVREYFEPLFVEGGIPSVLDENSPEYDDVEVDKVYNAILTVEEWISFLPREKVLSIYEYVIENKSELYK